MKENIEPTARQLEILLLLDSGMTHLEAAVKTGISCNTVHSHMGSLYLITGISNVRGSVRVLVQRGILYRDAEDKLHVVKK